MYTYKQKHTYINVHTQKHIQYIYIEKRTHTETNKDTYIHRETYTHTYRNIHTYIHNGKKYVLSSLDSRWAGLEDLLVSILRFSFLMYVQYYRSQ